MRKLLLLLLFPVTSLAANNVLYWEATTSPSVDSYNVYGSLRGHGEKIFAPYSPIGNVPASATMVPCPDIAGTQCYTFTHVVPDNKDSWIYYVTSVENTGTPDEAESGPSNPAEKIFKGGPNPPQQTHAK